MRGRVGLAHSNFLICSIPCGHRQVHELRKCDWIDPHCATQYNDVLRNALTEKCVAGHLSPTPTARPSSPAEGARHNAELPKKGVRFWGKPKGIS